MIITGQEHILNYLKKSIEKNKISHAYLFEGSDLPTDKQGRSQKKIAALWFARCLECQESKGPCNECRSCQDIEKNQHPDVMTISLLKDKKEISIEQIRKLRRYLSLSPHNSPYKITIIEEAEKMNQQAANALLKVLEEPQGNAVLILITNIASSLLDTIISRCEEIKFKAVSLDKVSKDFIKKEYIDILKKPLNDAFKCIEKTSQEKKETLLLLDGWLIWFREQMIKVKSHGRGVPDNFIKIIKEIQKIKNLIYNTNVNKRLALENLILEIKKTQP